MLPNHDNSSAISDLLVLAAPPSQSRISQCAHSSHRCASPAYLARPAATPDPIRGVLLTGVGQSLRAWERGESASRVVRETGLGYGIQVRGYRGWWRLCGARDGELRGKACCDVWYFACVETAWSM